MVVRFGAKEVGAGPEWSRARSLRGTNGVYATTVELDGPLREDFQRRDY